MEKLPKGWGEVTIGEIANVVTGNTPKKTNPENYNGKIPYYKPKDLDQGASIMKTETTISEIGLLESRELPPHSILVTCIGATIGKTGYIR